MRVSLQIANENHPDLLEVLITEHHSVRSVPRRVGYINTGHGAFMWLARLEPGRPNSLRVNQGGFTFDEGKQIISEARRLRDEGRQVIEQRSQRDDDERESADAGPSESGAGEPETETA